MKYIYFHSLAGTEAKDGVNGVASAPQKKGNNNRKFK
jgi:hypothetical protein